MAMLNAISWEGVMRACTVPGMVNSVIVGCKEIGGGNGCIYLEMS